MPTVSMPLIVLQTESLGGAVNTIISVLPREFHFAPAEPAEFWTTLHAPMIAAGATVCTEWRGSKMASPFRLRRQMTLIAQHLEKQYPDSNRDQGATAVRLPDVIIGTYARYWWCC
jgi:macrolide transport system ATP-binding/permease protein